MLSHVARAAVVLGILFGCREAVAQAPDPAEQALKSGLEFLNRRELEKARGPLEAALQLARDDAFRLKVYRSLITVYRTLPETDKMTEACEFVLRHAESLTDRSSVANSLGSFYFQRGKVEEQLRRYRERLAADADDYAAIAMLAELARPAKLDRAAVEQYRNRYLEAQRKLAARLAVLREQDAAADEAQQTWNWKEAAVLWSKAGDRAKALEAARHAERTGPEKRGSMLLHFWHAALGDVYLAEAEYADAARHFERAIETTTIVGYQETCKTKLRSAKEKLTEKK